jgi:hypothetical protein
MRSPSSIAVVPAIAVVVAVLTTRASAVVSHGFTETLIEPVVLGGFVWVGTYFGARWAPPLQRTGRLARVLGVLYLVAGVALTMPIKTHAVLLNMSRGEGDTGVLAGVTPTLIICALPLALLGVLILVARGLAVVCGGRVRRDA